MSCAEIGELLLQNALPFLVGLTVSLVLGLLARKLTTRVESESDWPRSNSDQDYALHQAVRLEHKAAVTWIGVIEIFLFFLSLWIRQPLLIGAWLTFKLGSKWQVWQSIVKVPAESADRSEQLAWLGARHRWASKTLQVFLLGTLANIVSGLGGFAVGRFLEMLLEG